MQNIHVPADGVRVAGRVSFDEVAAAIVPGWRNLENPQVLCGTLVDEAILQTIERYRALAGRHGRLLRDSGPLAYPTTPGRAPPRP